MKDRWNKCEGNCMVWCMMEDGDDWACIFLFFSHYFCFNLYVDEWMMQGMWWHEYWWSHVVEKYQTRVLQVQTIPLLFSLYTIYCIAWNLWLKLIFLFTNVYVWMLYRVLIMHGGCKCDMTWLINMMQRNSWLQAHFKFLSF